MVSFKFLTITLFFIQLHAFGLCDSRDDAEEAISLFYRQLVSVIRLVERNVSDMWDADVSNMSETINDQLEDDIEQFKLLVHNVTLLAENYTNVEDCLSGLDIFVNASNYRVDAIDVENMVFENLLRWAYADIQSGINKYYELNQEFTQNCLRIGSNCDGLSKGIIAEVNRFLPIIRRIPHHLFAEIYLLNFRIASNWRTSQARLMEDYHKVMERATICLGSVIKESNQITLNTTQTQENLGDSIEEFYRQLVVTVDYAYSSSYTDLTAYVTDVYNQISADYANSVTKVRNVTQTVNNTVNSLRKVAQDLNINFFCNVIDVQSAFNSTIARILNDYNLLLVDLVNSHYAEGFYKINLIASEVRLMKPQVEACKAEDTCDYLTQKIVEKTSEIPLLVQKELDSTAAVFLQTVPAVWKSGAKAARDLLEQLETEIVSLKNCIQGYLYFY